MYLIVKNKETIRVALIIAQEGPDFNKKKQAGTVSILEACKGSWPHLEAINYEFILYSRAGAVSRPKSGQAVTED